MGTKKGLWSCWCSVLCLSVLLIDRVLSNSHVDNKSCTSSCGMITNISYPFRLPHDPPHCGDPNYELACENNVTLLHLLDRYGFIDGTYRILGINYNNFTIRIRDPGIQEGNCSSFPLYFSSPQNFSGLYFANFYLYRTSTPNSEGTESLLIKQVGYLKCSDPVRDDAVYLDTAPCVNWKSKGSGGHLYAVAGDLLASQFQPQCRLKLLTLIASDLESVVPSGRIKSYADIHTLLSSGFELSWWQRACADLHCPNGTNCVFSHETQGLQCPSIRKCVTPLGKYYDSCRRLPTLRIFAEDYLHGIMKGLNRIVYMYIDDKTFYDAGLSSKLLIKLGKVTGRFVLPYITMRFLFGTVLLSTLLIYKWRRRHLSIYGDIEDFIRLHELIPIRYCYNDLKKMTKGFKYKLGEGGFGTVYKGRLISGPYVAIKMLGKSKANCQDFINEVATIGRIHHVNVVHLVGFCVEGTKRALVYEFMSHGSLDKYIFSKQENISLSYHKIYEIALGVARGIAYLHHGCDMQILHFDIKPHNILLNGNFTPKISDFGLARSYSLNDSIVTLTAARGTRGYMAPELFYKNIGRVSYKADIYSFGMLLVEMTSQRRNLNPQAEHSSQIYFPLWIYDQFDDDKDIEMEHLMEKEKDLVKKMLIIAFWCIQLKPDDHPSMNKVIEMLEANDIESLEMPPKPSLYPIDTVFLDDISDSDEITSIVSIHSHANLGEGTSNVN